MRCSRRRLLTTAAAALAAGCSPVTQGAQTLPPERARVRRQRLEPHLRLALPHGAVDPETLAGFRDLTRVVPTVDVQQSDESLLLELAADPDGSIDVALVDEAALRYLVSAGAVEPLAGSLLPNRRYVGAPFDDPPYDRGSRHSVPKDYITIGYAVATAVLPSTADGWGAVFRLARRHPGRVSVPDDASVVIGAALTALGYDWASDAGAELRAAGDLLQRLRGALRVEPGLARPWKPSDVAGIVSSLAMRPTPQGVRYVVPVEAAIVRMRSYCIPVLAPHPVSAHAWLDYTLEPATAAEEVRFTGRASPVGPAVRLLPASVLANPAVYPPVARAGALRFADVSAAGAEARDAIWAQFVAP